MRVFGIDIEAAEFERAIALTVKLTISHLISSKRRNQIGRDDFTKDIGSTGKGIVGHRQVNALLQFLAQE